MSTHLILTVGTGTAGRHSNLTEGLKAAIRLTAPTAIHLVPSEDEVSRDLVADEVRAAFPQYFRPWGDSAPFRCVEKPDDLECCRAAVREVIERAKQEGATRILVNPTSGTKQMTAGATLAALDAGLAELSFIVGERVDGVVKTGTERLTTWSADRWLAEQALADAHRLYAAGAYAQAGFLLARHASGAPDLITRPAALCELAAAWSSLDFASAARHATKLGDTARAARFATLAREAGEEQPTPAVVAESLAVAHHCARIHDHEAALHGYYRTIELALKRRIFELTKTAHPWPADAVSNWPLPDDLKQRLLNKRGKNDTIRAGLNEAQQVGDALGDPLAAASRTGDTSIRIFAAVDMRNNLSHHLRKIEASKVQSFGDLVTKLLKDHLKNFPAPVGLPLW